MHTFIWEVLNSNAAKVTKPPLKLWLHFSWWQIWSDVKRCHFLHNRSERVRDLLYDCSCMPLWGVHIDGLFGIICRVCLSFPFELRWQPLLRSTPFSPRHTQTGKWTTAVRESPYKHTHLNACYKCVQDSLSHRLLYRLFKPSESTIWDPL